MSYTIEWEDQYDNVERFEHGYVSVRDAIAFADYLYQTRKDYHRIAVVEDKSGRVAHEYSR